MQEKLIVAQKQISEVTHTTITALVVIIFIISTFIVLPTYNSRFIPITIKILVIIGIIVIVYTSYHNIDNIINFIGDDSNTLEEFEAINKQISYNYVMNFALTVFLTYIIYTCF